MLKRYREVFEKIPGIEVKKKANPDTSMNGNMFSFLDKSGALCLRFSKADRSAVMDKHQLEPAEQHGAIMKEYVGVLEHIAVDPNALRTCFEKFVAYALSLPAKATKRR